METAHYYFGGGGSMLLHPLVAVAMAVAIILICRLPRKYVIVPVILMLQDRLSNRIAADEGGHSSTPRFN